MSLTSIHTGVFATCLTILIACEPTRSQTPRPNHAQRVQQGEQLATFAGGCFWCMETPFENIRGIRKVVSGYSGGKEQNPTYKQVASGRTGHTETVQIVFDPKRVSYDQLLEIFWHSFDPTDIAGQFADRGTQYRPEIFVHNEAQRQAAKRSMLALTKSGRFEASIVVPITPFTRFWPAEDYHQDYYLKEPAHYKRYQKASGREYFLQKTWGKDLLTELQKTPQYQRPSLAELKRKLTPLQFQVTQQDSTEQAFHNEYWNNKQPGLYVDIVSGEPLFSSLHKFKSGTGWPSFYRPVIAGNVVQGVDYKLGYPRGEVRSKFGDSHLGHVFPDGPKPTGLRYCVNSASLRFIPVADLKKAGYGEFTASFQVQKPGGKATSRPTSRPTKK